MPATQVKHWLADTGCGCDLVSQKHAARISDQIKASKPPLTFSTANGATDATEDICLKLDELGEDIEPYVLPSTPAVLPIGRRCLDQGYDFRWPAGKMPYFISPAGKIIELVVVDYVPYLPTSRKKHIAHVVVNLQKRHGITATVTVETPRE